MAGTGGDAGAGKMMATLVFVAGFLIVMVFLLVSFAPILQSNNYQQKSDLTALGFSASDMATYTFFNTTQGGSNYLITPDKVSWYVALPQTYAGINPTIYGGWSNMTFDPPGAGSTDIHLYIQGNASLSGTGGYIKLWAHWGLWDAGEFAISYDDVIAKMRDVGGKQRADIVFYLDHPYTLFVICPANTNAADILYTNNGYIVAVGQSLEQSYEDAGKNAWNYVIGIITFNIPGGGTGSIWFDLMLSVVIDAALLFVAYWSITRLIGALMV